MSRKLFFHIISYKPQIRQTLQSKATPETIPFSGINQNTQIPHKFESFNIIFVIFMSLSTLLLDIKILIALLDPAIYYHLYRYDPEFSQYTKTLSARRQYKLQFNKPIIFTNHSEIWYLFNRKHREDDLPAVTYFAV